MTQPRALPVQHSVTTMQGLRDELALAQEQIARLERELAEARAQVATWKVKYEEADKIGDLLSHALDSKNESVIELQEELEKTKQTSSLPDLEKAQGYNV